MTDGPPEPASSRPEPQDSDGSHPDHLRVLFLDVTGTEAVVETQTREGAKRTVPPDGSDPGKRVSEYVAEMAAADGLGDAFGDPTDALEE